MRPAGRGAGRHRECCAALRLLAAARAVAAGAHNERGFGQGAAWLAHQSGTTGAQARQALETAEGLADCPHTKAAFLAGDISLSQAGEITRAEADTAGAGPNFYRWPATLT